MSSEVHIMQTKHFISPSVTVFRVIGHKNSENTHIEKNGFLVKINTVPGVYKITINTVAKGLI
jgi:predicted permease